MTALPEITRPDELAKRLGWSERRVRETARSLGAHIGQGKNMRFLPPDVARISAVASGEDAQPTTTRRSRRSDQVYFFAHYGFVKIGWTANWKVRLSTLQTACPYRVEAIAVYRGGLDFERKLHTIFAEYRTRSDGEWFRDCDAIRKYIADHKGACLLR